MKTAAEQRYERQTLVTESPAMLATALLHDLDSAGLPTSYTFDRVSSWDSISQTWNHYVGTVLPDVTYYAFRVAADDRYVHRGEIDSRNIPAFGIRLSPHLLQAARAAVLHLYGRFPAAIWIDCSPRDRERQAARDYSRIQRAADHLARQAAAAEDAAADAVVNCEDPARVEIILSRADAAARQAARMQRQAETAGAELRAARNAAIREETQTRLF